MTITVMAYATVTLKYYEKISVGPVSLHALYNLCKALLNTQHLKTAFIVEQNPFNVHSYTGYACI